MSNDATAKESLKREERVISPEVTGSPSANQLSERFRKLFVVVAREIAASRPLLP